MNVVRREESIGQSYGTQFQASDKEILGAICHDQFGRATADIDDQRSRRNVDGLLYTEMDESSLFDAGDDLDLDPGFLECTVDEFRCIRSFANSTRSHCPNRSIVRARDVGHVSQRDQSSFESGFAEGLHVARAFAQSHHGLLARNDVEAISRHTRDDEMKAVRSDVERCDGCFRSHLVRD